MDTAGLTRDAFLGGRLTVLQPSKGYRAGIDPVLLAAATPATPGQSVLELGCGAGTALFCLAARVTGLSLTGLELQPDYADLARRNAVLNGIEAEIVTGDLADMPAALRAQTFDHVLANPPYFPAGAHSASPDTGRQTARGETAPLATWIDAATRRLTPGGTLTVIQRAERLPDLLAACDSRLGSLKIKPIAPRTGRPARLILLQATKGGRAAPQLLAPLILHAGPRHERDGEDYTAEIQAILRSPNQLSIE